MSSISGLLTHTLIHIESVYLKQILYSYDSFKRWRVLNISQKDSRNHTGLSCLKDCLFWGLIKSSPVLYRPLPRIDLNTQLTDYSFFKNEIHIKKLCEMKIQYLILIIHWFLAHAFPHITSSWRVWPLRNLSYTLFLETVVFRKNVCST